VTRAIRAIDLHKQDPARCARVTARLDPDAVVKVWLDGDLVVFALTGGTAVTEAVAGDALLSVATKIARDGL